MEKKPKESPWPHQAPLKEVDYVQVDGPPSESKIYYTPGAKNTCAVTVTNVDVDETADMDRKMTEHTNRQPLKKLYTKDDDIVTLLKVQRHLMEACNQLTRLIIDKQEQ